MPMTRLCHGATNRQKRAVIDMHASGAKMSGKLVHARGRSRLLDHLIGGSFLSFTGKAVLVFPSIVGEVE